MISFMLTPLTGFQFWMRRRLFVAAHKSHYAIVVSMVRR
jgi:hypothetical protein